MVILSEEFNPFSSEKINLKIHQIVPTKLLTKVEYKKEHKNLSVTRITSTF